jgi:DNA mismatch repair protein MutS
MQLFTIANTPTSVPPRRRRSRVTTDELLIDRQTFRDLEIFEADGPSLYDLVNRARTTGGSKVLRTRMTRPWSRPEKILSVQESLRCILKHRTAFNLLPGEGVLSAMEQYLHSGIALVETNYRIEHLVESLEIRFGDRKNYTILLRGVHRTAAILRSLQRFAYREELLHAPGELGPLMSELRNLLEHPAFMVLPGEGEVGMSCWRVMRLDRMLRLDERPAVDRLLRIVFEIDALVSMADTTDQCGFVIPELVDGPIEIVADGVFHPFLTNPVPNPLRLGPDSRLLFVTGPNMAGKTTYLRACGMAIYLAHLGMGVPARGFRFSPSDTLFTAISLTDNVREGVSFFRAEALRVKTIAQSVAEGRAVVALFDEPFMGTNVKDALDASRAVLSRLASKEGSVFIVSSHLIELRDPLSSTVSVECCRFEANDQSGRLEFDYVLRPGVSSQRLGLRVLQEEGVFDLLDAMPDEQ